MFHRAYFALIHNSEMEPKWNKKKTEIKNSQEKAIDFPKCSFVNIDHFCT
jgi:hypothetical protein